MNKGLEVLLKRMQTHPDEFEDLFNPNPTQVRDQHLLQYPPTQKENRWRLYTGIVLDPAQSAGFVTDNERALYRESYQQIQGDSFTSNILKKLMLDDSNDTT